MISKERVEEIEYYFWEETSEEETQEWREDLNQEESAYVDELDKAVCKGVGTLCQELLKSL